jgi:PmbA protein
VNLDRLIEAVRTIRPDGIAVRDWRFYVTEGRRLSLGIKDRETGNPNAPLTISDSGSARYLLVWEDGRISRGHLERRQVEAEPGEALKQTLQAAYDDPDAAQVLGPQKTPHVELHDPHVAELAGGESSSLVERLGIVRERVSTAGVRTWSGSFSFSEGDARLVTSAGLDVSGKGTSAGWHVTVNGEIGDGFSARQLESRTDFESRLDRLLETAGRLENEAPTMPGGRHRVILHPRVVESYALNTLLTNLEGASVAHGEGHFRIDQFGSDTPLLREDLTLRLDPLEPMKSGSYRFTREGLPAARCAFIDRGRLVQPVLDLKYARRLGLAPTPIPYSADTLHLEGPTRLPLARALERTGNGALVLSVLGVHTQDSASGDFSLSAPQALRIEGGEFTGKLKATISGNLFELLCGAGMEMVSFEGEHTPGLAVDCQLDPK